MSELKKVQLQFDAEEVARIIMDKIGMKSFEQSPLLQITLDDINSVPTVYYNGEEIKGKMRVSFDWKTDDCYINPTYIHVDHWDSVGQRNNMKTIQHNHPITIDKRLSDC